MKRIAENLWVQSQDFQYLGLNIGTRMTIIRLKNNELIIISPIKLTNKIIEQFNQLGRVKHLVLPNLFHHLFVSDWVNHYPESKIYADEKLQSKRPDLMIDNYLNYHQSYFSNELAYLPFKGIQTFVNNGIFPLEEYAFFHPESKTLILTDTAFYFDESFSLSTQFIFRLIGGYKQLQPSLLEKIATKNKSIVQDSLEDVLKWDFQRVIVAHGNIVEQNAKEKLKQGYTSFA